MKFVCARKDLYEGVQLVGRAVSPRTSLPILGHLLINAEGDRLRISATDLEIGMQCVVPARVEEPGDGTVHARTITEILAALPDTDVSVSCDESNSAILKCATSDFTLLGLPPEEFPQLPEVREEVRFVVERDVLREGVRKTAFGVSRDDSRAILTGILMEVTGDGLKLVSTDTHRLCLQECPLIECEGVVNAIVPERAMNELTRFVPEGEGSVSVSLSASQVMFRVDDNVLVSRLIEGQFPNYRKVVPEQFNRKLTIPAEQFRQSVKRAWIVARDNSLRTIFQTEDGTLVLSAESGSVGTAHEQVEVIRDGDDFKMAFNAEYLLNVLDVLDVEAIEMELSGELSPAVIRPQGKDDYTYVIMPMQLQ